MNEPKYISHIRKNADGSIAFQSNEEHCQNVAELAKQFAAEFGMGDFGYVMGLLHDKGKEKAEFQNYIRYENGLTDKKTYTQEGKAHAYVGGILAKESYSHLYPILSYPIAGHHTGLDDYFQSDGSRGLKEKMSQIIPSEVEKIDITNNIHVPSFLSSSSICEVTHVTRMLFSCLKDADCLNTEQFMNIETYKLRNRTKASIADLLPKLEDYLIILNQQAQESEVNRIRRIIQKYCREKSSLEKGFFGLTVPTGGGKTLSSLLWAMLHAAKHNLKRVIIAIPYTSIIVQTARILKNIFGEENVLEHHCNFDVEQITDEEAREKMTLAMDNWDFPIIVTTNVQLFESMFSSNGSDCRKLHNIVNSVIILDEVQTLPIPFLNPIINALKTYQALFGISVLFTTASQPILCGMHKSLANNILNGIDADYWNEIVPESEFLHDKLRRVELSFDNSISSYEEIAARITKHKVVLCIVNSKKDAREIYNRLPHEGITIHLSRWMHPEHIAASIEIIKVALKNRYPVVRVISTQLVEAGVDLDFPIVFRQEAGLDSILQAAGRCNREGKLNIGKTYVFRLENRPTKGQLAKSINAFQMCQGEIEDWFSPEAMKTYFKKLYLNANFDEKEIDKQCKYSQSEGSLVLNFDTIHNLFELIDNKEVPIVVLSAYNKELIEKVKENGFMKNTDIKQLCKYTVSVSKHDYERLFNEKLIKEIVRDSGLFATTSYHQYNPNVGLLFDNIELHETYII